VLVVGLGNPGIEFVSTRHNAGAEVVATLAERHQGRLRSEKGLHAEVCEVRMAGRRILLAVPTTFMNESGQAVAPLVRRAGIDQGDGGAGDGPVAERLIVVHDELDLPSGRVKIKAGGGNAGNNGLKSIESHLHTNRYLRVRVGIGKPPGRQSGADYVLKRPGAAERAILDVAIEEAADAVEALVTDGLAAAMNRFNASDGGASGPGDGK
jgi:peptidyl-tRNA hydrolase, PTH1 family